MPKVISKTAALGLGCEEAALKEFLNLGLDDPLPQREMKGLRGFHYWAVVDYVGYRSLVKSCLSESNIVFPEMPHVDSMSSEEEEAFLSPTRKRRLRRRAAKLQWSWRTQLW